MQMVLNVVMPIEHLYRNTSGQPSHRGVEACVRSQNIKRKPYIPRPFPDDEEDEGGDNEWK